MSETVCVVCGAPLPTDRAAREHLVEALYLEDATVALLPNQRTVHRGKVTVRNRSPGVAPEEEK